MTGAIRAKGVADDVNDRAYIVIEGEDGRAAYVGIGGEDQLAGLEKGHIVTVSPPSHGPRPSDHVIARIASQNEGRYSPDLHALADGKAKPEYIQAHVRRLEAMRRAGHVTRQPDGSWGVPSDYLKRAASYEKAAALHKPVQIKVQSHLTLPEMAKAIGSTWLDERLRAQGDAQSLRGFGQDLNQARAARRAFLIERGFMTPGQARPTPSTLMVLKTADLESLASDITDQIGKSYNPHSQIGRVEGVYRNAVLRPSGKFAVIERAKDFTLVPWREVMDRHLGKAIRGVSRDGNITWHLTKGRGIS